jgi:hypothetical protein
MSFAEMELPPKAGSYRASGGNIARLAARDTDGKV